MCIRDRCFGSLLILVIIASYTGLFLALMTLKL